MTPQDREDVFIAAVATGVDPLTAYVAANDARRPRRWLTWQWAIVVVAVEVLSVYVLYRLVCG